MRDQILKYVRPVVIPADGRDGGQRLGHDGPTKIRRQMGHEIS